ncbi:hypothetical protein LCGC14_2924640 [marine sediment metagenome]|uniref:Uncharacterized protein n=1 Tax=marine sediment metagenome TaxID=412755 RepID=A0A0F8XN48_9ZZZZ
MSRLYGKVWAEGNVGKMSTRGGHKELTSQMLYGSASDQKIGAEVTIKVLDDGTFRILVNIPALGIDEAVDLDE